MNPACWSPPSGMTTRMLDPYSSSRSSGLATRMTGLDRSAAPASADQPSRTAETRARLDLRMTAAPFEVEGTSVACECVAAVSERLHPSRAIRSELIADRQAPDPLSSRGEDGVAQRRRDRRHAGLAHAAERRVEAGSDEMHPDVARRDVDACDLVVVEIALLDPAGLEADLGDERVARAHHTRAFDLRADPVWIDLRPAVECHVDARDRDLALLVHHHLHHGGHVGDEAVMGGNPEALAGGQFSPPAGLLRRR